jgi:hypothetical protein
VQIAGTGSKRGIRPAFSKAMLRSGWQTGERATTRHSQSVEASEESQNVPRSKETGRCLVEPRKGSSERYE